VIALVTLLIIYHDRIVDALKPAAAWMKRLEHVSISLHQKLTFSSPQDTRCLADPDRDPHRSILPTGKYLLIFGNQPRAHLLVQLIGHEIVLIIVGFTWGLGAGFGIAAAGTFFGELVTF
jgi:hypothetical protein